MTARAQQDPLATPLSIYEAHLGSWMRIPEEENRWLIYSELAINLIPYMKNIGYANVEPSAITEHQFDGSRVIRPPAISLSPVATDILMTL